MKYKHLAIIILFIGSLSRIWTIESYPTVLGIISILFIISFVSILAVHIAINWNKHIINFKSFKKNS